MDAEYEAPPPDLTRAFHAVLRESYDLKVTVRENHGMDIDGACGQLAVKKVSQSARKSKANDIEDIVATPKHTGSPQRHGVSPSVSDHMTSIQRTTIAILACTLATMLLYKYAHK